MDGIAPSRDAPKKVETSASAITGEILYVDCGFSQVIASYEGVAAATGGTSAGGATTSSPGSPS